MSINLTASIINITDQEFNEMVRFVYDKYGIDLKKKRQLIEGRLSSTLRSKQLDNFTQYLKLLQSPNGAPEVQIFLNKITTNHSYFARETDHFDYLSKVVLPALQKTNKREIRIWSAGCSSGQEAYNIAMVIDQFFGSLKGNLDTTILATDISTNVLGKAQSAIYSPDNLVGLPDAWINQYFNKLDNGNYQVVEKIRNEVVFRVANLMEPFVYKQPFDVIFCRNVMIYFDFETNQQLIKKFYQATANNGCLFVGHSESVDKNQTEYTCVKPAIYQKLNKGR